MRIGKAVLLGASLIAIAAVRLPAQQRREVKWNLPPARAIPGIEHHSFRSPSMDLEVGYNVYTPPAYARGSARFPVIYFLHGAGGDENSDAGGFSGLVARLIEQKAIPPVICVFPNGGMSGYRDDPQAKVMGETLIVKELVPLVDRTYRTQAVREGRVLAGFSMGGGGSVRLAFKHPETFSAAASWAGAIQRRGGGTVPELEPEALRKVAGKVRLL
jgi:enterochelin esterase-like enzyme